jgi:hypothetical protein
MNQRTQIYVLSALLALLTAIVLNYLSGKSPLAITLSGDQKFFALDVKDPALRLDRLERIRKLAYPGMRRNIFNRELPPKPQPVVPPQPVPPPLPIEPVVQVLQVPLKFYGLTVDPRSGKRRAFFTNGEDVFIAAEGDTLLTRYRLLRIGNTTADFEEVGTGLRATLPLEQPVQAPQG